MKEHSEPSKPMTSEDYLKLLPEDLRDFHDQKDFFKALHAHYSKEHLENKIPGNWVDNHVFTIDFFLWFMAQHGYRLQRFKSRRFKQHDLTETISHYNNQRIDLLSKILKQHERK